MIYIQRPRGGNKTTTLCYLSEATRYPIVTHSQRQVAYIKELAEKLQLNIPDPITVEDIRHNGKTKGRHDISLLIDDAEDIIEAALTEYLSAKPFAVTLTKNK